MNSIAYCIKFRAQNDVTQEIFDQLGEMYERALRIDPNDVEANFNSGLLYLQYSSELETSLRFFMASVQRDVPNDRRSEMFRAQFSKAYYNIGMIYDKMGKTQEACDSYKKSLKKCEEDPQKKLT